MTDLPPRICRSNKLHPFWTVVCITGRKVKPKNECVLPVVLSHRTSASSKDSPVCTSGRLLCPLSSSHPGARWGGPTGAVPGRRRGVRLPPAASWPSPPSRQLEGACAPRQFAGRNYHMNVAPSRSRQLGRPGRGQAPTLGGWGGLQVLC